MEKFTGSGDLTFYAKTPKVFEDLVAYFKGFIDSKFPLEDAPVEETEYGIYTLIDNKNYKKNLYSFPVWYSSSTREENFSVNEFLEFIANFSSLTNEEDDFALVEFEYSLTYMNDAESICDDLEKCSSNNKFDIKTYNEALKKERMTKNNLLLTEVGAITYDKEFLRRLDKMLEYVYTVPRYKWPDGALNAHKDTVLCTKEFMEKEDIVKKIESIKDAIEDRYTNKDNDFGKFLRCEVDLLKDYVSLIEERNVTFDIEEDIYLE